MPYETMTLCTITQFAEQLGISRDAVNRLRRDGVIPFIGHNPCYIPYEAACSAIVEHAAKNAAKYAAAMSAKEVKDDAEEA